MIEDSGLVTAGTQRPYTEHMLQTVREQIRTVFASNVVVAFVALAVVLLIAGAYYYTATSGAEEATSTSPQVTANEASTTSGSDDSSSGGIIRGVIGFGMISGWVLAVGVSVRRGQARQRAVAHEQGAT